MFRDVWSGLYSLVVVVVAAFCVYVCERVVVVCELTVDTDASECEFLCVHRFVITILDNLAGDELINHHYCRWRKSAICLICQTRRRRGDKQLIVVQTSITQLSLETILCACVYALLPYHHDVLLLLLLLCFAISRFPLTSSSASWIFASSLRSIRILLQLSRYVFFVYLWKQTEEQFWLYSGIQRRNLQRQSIDQLTNGFVFFTLLLLHSIVI